MTIITYAYEEIAHRNGAKSVAHQFFYLLNLGGRAFVRFFLNSLSPVKFRFYADTSSVIRAKRTMQTINNCNFIFRLIASNQSICETRSGVSAHMR